MRRYDVFRSDVSACRAMCSEMIACGAMCDERIVCAAMRGNKNDVRVR